MERLLKLLMMSRFILGAIAITGGGYALGLSAEALFPVVAGFWIATK